VKPRDLPALAVFLAALALLVGLVVYVMFFKVRERPAPAPAVSSAPVPAPPPAPTPAPAPPRQAPPGFNVKPVIPPPLPADLQGKARVWPLQAGMTWVYRVEVEPPAWRDITLTYRTVQQADALEVQAEFRHAKGETKFNLGTYQANDPSHANTRFPGFFMHAAYFGPAVGIGDRLTWSWPWQMPDGSVRPGRIKRYDGVVAGTDNLGKQALGADYPAMRIEAILSYLEDGQVRATAKETLWYSGKGAQLVRVLREGATPDESSRRIVAELVEIR
jgi:hypothetical protein